MQLLGRGEFQLESLRWHALSTRMLTRSESRTLFLKHSHLQFLISNMNGDDINNVAF